MRQHKHDLAFWWRLHRWEVQSALREAGTGGTWALLVSVWIAFARGDVHGATIAMLFMSMAGLIRINLRPRF